MMYVIPLVCARYINQLDVLVLAKIILDNETEAPHRY